ncbi:MAG: D-alanyl-D-alanine carboxypeptidase family protein [Oscillospiraceae bacterium]
MSLLLAFSLLLSPAALALEDPQPAATAAILVDADHGEVLYEKSAHEHRFPASITKVMTGLLTLEAVERGDLQLDTPITAQESMNRDLSIYGSTQDIKIGEVMSVGDLLHCLLIPSANEAANILAQAVSGDIDTFIALMNSRAAELGCKDTHFANAHGLHHAEHYTTAYDIYLFVNQAMKNPTFREIVSSKSYTVPPTNLHEERVLHDTNALVSTFNIRGYYYPYAIGVKTGSTPEAGQCLAAAAVKDGRMLISVVLGAQNVKQENGEVLRQSFSESRRLFDWGFQNFTRQTVLDGVTPLRELPVTLSDEVSAIALRPERSLEATLPNDIDLSAFSQEVKLYHETVEAPVKAGQVFGEVTVKNGTTAYGTIPLVAVQDVERSPLLYRIHQIKEFFSQLWVKILLVVLILLAAVVLLRFTLFKPRRRGGGYRGGRR